MISILMPIYNCLPYLENAWRSLLWQTFADWELVAVDDGSQDGSREFMCSWAERDARVRIISLPHSGIVKALNCGLEQCRSEWVARMDGDDISAPQRLYKQWQYIQKNDVDILGSYVRLFPRLQRSLGMRRYERWLNRYWRHRDLVRDIFVESPLVHPSVMFRRAKVLEVGGYRECPWPEDYDLWLRLWKAGARFGKVPEVLLYWRDTPQRLTRTDSRCTHGRLRQLKLQTLLECYFPHCLPSSNIGQKERRQAIIWGAGTNGKDLVRDLRALGLHPAAFVDNHPSRRGQTILDMPVLGPEDIGQPGEFFAIMAVSNPYVRAEVRSQLDGLGWVEGRDYACLANMSR